MSTTQFDVLCCILQLLDDSSEDVLVLDGGLRLLLTKPTPENEGLYRCVADNAAGIIDKSFTITVNGMCVCVTGTYLCCK